MKDIEDRVPVVEIIAPNRAIIRFYEQTQQKVIAVGKRIRHLRHRERASQETIANELGISIPASSKIKTDIISRLYQIAALFNVRPKGLLSEKREVFSEK